MTYHSRWQRSSARDAAAEQALLEEQTPAFNPPPPAEWMPLDEVAQAWATFGAHTRHPWGWQATSSAFAALAQEAAACQQACAGGLPTLPARVYPAASDPHEALCAALEEGLACWQSALLWLEQLVRHQPSVAVSGEEETAITSATLLSLSRWHRTHLRALLARFSREGIQAPPPPAPMNILPRPCEVQP